MTQPFRSRSRNVRRPFRYRDSLSCLSGCNEGGGPTKADKRGPQNKARLPGGTFDPVMPLSRGTTLGQEAMGMLVLVARASKHGATEEITERVAQALTLTGQVGQLAPQRAGPLSLCRSPVRARRCQWPPVSRDRLGGVAEGSQHEPDLEGRVGDALRRYRSDAVLAVGGWHNGLGTVWAAGAFRGHLRVGSRGVLHGQGTHGGRVRGREQTASVALLRRTRLGPGWCHARRGDRRVCQWR